MSGGDGRRCRRTRSTRFEPHRARCPLLRRHFDAVSVANNHSGDYGPEAFRETLDNWLGGAPAVLRRRPRPAAKRTRRSCSKSAGSRSRCWATTSTTRARSRPRRISQAWPGRRTSKSSWTWRARAGPERTSCCRSCTGAGRTRPNPALGSASSLMRLIDAGADAVIGSHPHVTQGAEMYRGKPIVYSLGNFVFDLLDRPENAIGWVLQLVVDRDGVTRSRPAPCASTAKARPLLPPRSPRRAACAGRDSLRPVRAIALGRLPGESHPRAERIWRAPDEVSSRLASCRTALASPWLGALVRYRCLLSRIETFTVECRAMTIGFRLSLHRQAARSSRDFPTSGRPPWDLRARPRGDSGAICRKRPRALKTRCLGQTHERDAPVTDPRAADRCHHRSPRDRAGPYFHICGDEPKKRSGHLQAGRRQAARERSLVAFATQEIAAGALAAERQLDRSALESRSRENRAAKGWLNE